MSTFTDAKKLANHKAYREGLKGALGRVKAGPGIPFVYLEKFSFEDKERPLFLIDHDAKIVADLGHKPTGTGKCFLNEQGRLELALGPGKVHFAKLVKLFGDAGVARELQVPGEDDAPLPAKLPMKAGFREWRVWGDDAKSLIAAFDELLEEFKTLPPLKPAWTELLARHLDIKQAVAEIAKAEIVNDAKVRGDHEKEIRALTEKARKLRRLAQAQLLADARPKPVVGASRTAEDVPSKAPAGPGARRVAELRTRVATLPVALRDSFEAQLVRAKALLDKGDDAGALKLADQLVAMADKARARAAPGVVELQSVLERATHDVDAGLKKVPSGDTSSLEDDLKASAEFKAFDAMRRSPASVTDAKALADAADKLVGHIDAQLKLASDWKAHLAKTSEALKKELEDHLARSGEDGKVKLTSAFRTTDEYKAYQAASTDAGGYLKREAFDRIVSTMRTRLAGLGQQCVAWRQALEDADRKIAAALAPLPGPVGTAVDKALRASTEWKELEGLRARGKSAILPAQLVGTAAAKLQRHLADLADAETRRARGPELRRQLTDLKASVETSRLRCAALVARIDAPNDAIGLSWLSAGMSAELAADRTTIDGARAAAEALGMEVDSALSALSADPPAAVAIAGAETTLKKGVPNTDAAQRRADAHLRVATPQGRAALAQELVDAARADPNRMLSRDRGSRVLAEARKGAGMTQAQVIAAIDREVNDQQHPPLREWFKVLQLNNAKGGNIKLGSLGSVNIGVHRAVPLHMTLYVANVGDSPSINDGIDTIMNALLPPVNGDVGTHVTAELNGPISKGNPHVFHGEKGGRANDLAGEKAWPDVCDQMTKKLQEELARLRGLVQKFCAQKGRWAGD